VYYIAFFVPEARGGSSTAGLHYLANLGELHEPATISPCTITMDHDAIIYSMTDRLKRGPDQDVHLPSVGSQKYPSYNVECGGLALSKSPGKQTLAKAAKVPRRAERFRPKMIEAAAYAV